MGEDVTLVDLTVYIFGRLVTRGRYATCQPVLESSQCSSPWAGEDDRYYYMQATFSRLSIYIYIYIYIYIDNLSPVSHFYNTYIVRLYL